MKPEADSDEQAILGDVDEGKDKSVLRVTFDEVLQTAARYY